MESTTYENRDAELSVMDRRVSDRSGNAMLAAISVAVIMDRMAPKPRPGIVTSGTIMPGAPGVTIHRRPKRGPIPCWGHCGRRVSANKSHCAACRAAMKASGVVLDGVTVQVCAAGPPALPDVDEKAQ